MQVVASVGPVPAASTASHQSIHPELAAPRPPWPASSQFHAHWEEFARFPNYWEGYVLAGLLRSEDVPAKVISLWPVFDAGSSTVFVPRELMHRARWVLAWPAPSEAELTFLATGELETGEESQSGSASG
jgi:hypothetical protein